MQLRVLGPFEGQSAQGHAVYLRRREKALAGVLLLNAGTPCSADMLIQEVWGDDQPEDPGNTLRQVVSRIRRAFEPESFIATMGSGAYRADPPPGTLDKLRFEALVDSAAAAAREGQPAQEARLLEQAIACWPDPQAGFPDFPDSLGVREKTARLLEQRRRADFRLADLHIALGEHEAAIPGLRARCVTDPGSEKTWAQLMTALSLSGRQGEALDAYNQATQVLKKEYGITPGGALEAAHAIVLGDTPPPGAPGRP